MRSLGPALRAGQRDAARAALDLGDAFVVLNIGGVEPRKNTVRLLRAFERLMRELERVGRASILLLPGGETLLDHTPYRQEFLAALAASGLATAQRSDVRLLGVVADEQVPALYHAADMLAFPSVKRRFEDVGAVPKGSTPAELAAFLKSEIDKWGPVIRDARIKVEN